MIGLVLILLAVLGLAGGSPDVPPVGPVTVEDPPTSTDWTPVPAGTLEKIDVQREGGIAFEAYSFTIDDPAKLAELAGARCRPSCRRSTAGGPAPTAGRTASCSTTSTRTRRSCSRTTTPTSRTACRPSRRRSTSTSGRAPCSPARPTATDAGTFARAPFRASTRNGRHPRTVASRMSATAAPPPGAYVRIASRWRGAWRSCPGATTCTSRWPARGRSARSSCGA